MRTNIDIDETLLTEAMELGGLVTKKAAVEQALRDYVRVRRQTRAIDNLSGLGWAGDLDAQRADWDKEADWSLKGTNDHRR